MHRLSAVAPRPKFEHSVFGIFKDDLPQPDLKEERSGEKQWKEEIKNRSGLWHKNGKLLKPLKLDKIDISSSSRLNTSLPDTVGCSHRPQIPSGALTDRTGMGQRATVAFEKVRSSSSGRRQMKGQEIDEYSEEEEKSKEKEVPEELMLREMCSINCPRLRLICSICNVCARFTMCGRCLNGTCDVNLPNASNTG
jgi:hypothetical protein